MKIDDIVRDIEIPEAADPNAADLRIAVIGAGKMARLHLETLAAIGGSKLVGICNRSSDEGVKLAREFGIDSTFRDPMTMLDETAPDAVVIAVSHRATVDVAALALERGVPCLIEKPAGYTSHETQNLASLAKEHNCFNMVALNRRFYSVINQALLGVLHYGEIKGITVEAHEPIQDFRNRLQFQKWLYDDWLTANTIHTIDMLRMVGGDVRDVRSFSRSRSEVFGDSFVSSIEFENGVLGTFISHWNSVNSVSMKIFGEGVVAELSPLDSGFLSFPKRRRIKIKPGWADRKFKPGLYDQMKTFLQGVREGGQIWFPSSDLKDNVKTMELVEAIQGKNGAMTGELVGLAECSVAS